MLVEPIISKEKYPQIEEEDEDIMKLKERIEEKFESLSI